MAPICLLPSNTVGYCQPSGFTLHYYCLCGRECRWIGLGWLCTVVIRCRSAGSPASSSIGTFRHAATKLRLYRPRTRGEATRSHIISFRIINATPWPSIIRWDDSVAIVFRQQSKENFQRWKTTPSNPNIGPTTAWQRSKATPKPTCVCWAILIMKIQQNSIYGRIENENG